jgi:hypothetical protein
MAELDFSNIKPEPQLDFSSIRPKTLMDYADDAGTGFVRGMKKRKAGTLQAADDVRRWLGGDMGQPYSPFREGINKDAENLIKESRNAPFAEGVGEGIYNLGEGALAPIKGANLTQKFLWNLGTGAGFGATMPAGSPEERIDNAILGGGTSSVGMPVASAVGKGGLKVARTIGHAASDTFAKKDAIRAGAEEIANELGKGGRVSLATGGGSSGGGNAGGGSGFGGDDLNPWDQIEGAKPTAAMVFQTPEILQLEKAARVRSGTPFLERDLLNQTALWNSLKNRVYGKQELPPEGHEGVRNYLNSLANTITTPLRDDAMAAARAAKPQANVPSIPASLGLLLEDSSIPLRAKASGLINDVKTRSDENAKKLGKWTLGLLDDLDEAGLKVDPWDVYNIKKGHSDRLSASNSQSADDMTNATKAGRVHATGLMDAADAGLDAASGGKWGIYNRTHSGFMRPIDEVAAMGKVLDAFENAQTLPNRSSVPLVTRAKLDTAVSNNTWDHRGGQGYVDLLSPESRGLLDQAQDFTQAIEHAKGGGATTAISGSQSTPNLMQAAKNGLKKIGEANNLGWAINLADALGTSQGQRALDEALLDPKKMKTIVDAYNNGTIGIEYSPIIQAFKRSLRNVPSLLD